MTYTPKGVKQQALEHIIDNIERMAEWGYKWEEIPDQLTAEANANGTWHHLTDDVRADLAYWIVSDDEFLAEDLIKSYCYLDDMPNVFLDAVRTHCVIMLDAVDYVYNDIINDLVMPIGKKISMTSARKIKKTAEQMLEGL